MTTRRRVALVSDRPISPDLHYTGFAPRYVDLLATLGRDHELLVVYLEPEGWEFESHLRWATDVAEIARIPVPAWSAQRRDRVARAARQVVGRVPADAWENDLARRLDDWRPDVVITLLDDPFTSMRAVNRSFPTVSFIEEDQSTLPEQQRGLKGRALRVAEAAGRRRSSAPPAVSVVISEREEAWARRRSPRSEVVVVPHRLDLDHWEEPVAPAEDLGDDDVLVIGNMESRRNAEGLASVVSALGRPGIDAALRISVISFFEPHPLIRELPDELVRIVGRVDDPRPYYRAAGMTLVPAFIVPGVKTTILQGWATGCPVVTTGPAARSIGATPGVDVVSGETPPEVADALIRVAGDRALRDRLRLAGLARLHEAHSSDAAATAVGHAIEVAIDHGPEPASLTADLRLLASRTRRP